MSEVITVKAPRDIKPGDQLLRWNGRSLGTTEEWMTIVAIRKVTSQTHTTRYYVRVELPEHVDPMKVPDHFYLAASSRQRTRRVQP